LQEDIAGAHTYMEDTGSTTCTQTPPTLAACGGTQPHSVYKPPSADRLLSYVTSPKMKYRERTSEEKGGLVHCPHIKMIVNDVAFLTEKASAGDVVLYVGGTIGSYLPLVARMFPTLNFLVYDGHPQSQHYKNASEQHPPNIHLKAAWFNEHEAIEYTNLQQPKYSPGKTLLMVDTRNVTRWKKQTRPAVYSGKLSSDVPLFFQKFVRAAAARLRGGRGCLRHWGHLSEQPELSHRGERAAGHA